MQRSITIADETATGEILDRILIELQGWDVPLRELIKSRVRSEILRFKQNNGDEYKGLVAKQLGNGSPTLSWKVPDDFAIDEVEECQRAEEAFLRNGFMVIVEGKQVEDLDQILRLSPTSTIRFVRLIALQGG